MSDARRHLGYAARVEIDRIKASQIRITPPFRLHQRGGRASVVATAAQAARPDPVLIRALRAAHAMID